MSEDPITIFYVRYKSDSTSTATPPRKMVQNFRQTDRQTSKNRSELTFLVQSFVPSFFCHFAATSLNFKVIIENYQTRHHWNEQKMTIFSQSAHNDSPSHFYYLCINSDQFWPCHILAVQR